jgi:hypothetical protein
MDETHWHRSNRASEVSMGSTRGSPAAVELKSISVCLASHFFHGGVIVVGSIFTFGLREMPNDMKLCANALMKLVFLNNGVTMLGK